LQDDYTTTRLNDTEINADVVFAGADDAVNLWITTLARRVKPDIFIVIRQNHIQDRAPIEVARADVTFVQRS
jgi:hypothetical protein